MDYFTNRLFYYRIIKKFFVACSTFTTFAHVFGLQSTLTFYDPEQFV